MLVLKRTFGSPLDRVHIVLPDGRQVVVQVVDFGDGGHCRLGVTAPADVRIYRGELFARIDLDAPTPAGVADAAG